MAVELSQKCQYALRAIFEMSKRRGEGPIKVAEIAEAQAIPPRFLENILNELKSHGVVDSRRGKAGGYVLRANPDKLSVGEVVQLIQGPISVVVCDGGVPDQMCPFGQDCVFWPLWERVNTAIQDVYFGTSFGDLVRNEEARQAERVQTYVI